MIPEERRSVVLIKMIIVKTIVEGKLPTASVPIEKEHQQSAMIYSTSSNNSGRFESKHGFMVQALNGLDTQAGAMDKVAESDDNRENGYNRSYAIFSFHIGIMSAPTVILPYAFSSFARDVNSSTINSKSELAVEISEKGNKCSNNTIQKNGNEAGKVKRMTNTKPFKLRTDERGVFKGAKLGEKDAPLKLRRKPSWSLSTEMRISKMPLMKGPDFKWDILPIV